MALIASDLSGFTGSERFTRHTLVRSIVMSEGAMHVADAGGAHWLMDIIASNQLEPSIRRHEFQNWKLTTKHGEGMLVATDGNGHVIHEEKIHFTDFPLDEITLWFENRTIYLPSEH